MKEVNDIDQLLKDKLGERDIPFNESHWLAMEKMLDKRKRFAFFFFLFGLLAAAGIAGASMFWCYQSATTSIIEPMYNQEVIEINRRSEVKVQPPNEELLVEEGTPNEKQSSQSEPWASTSALAKKKKAADQLNKASKQGNTSESSKQDVNEGNGDEVLIGQSVDEEGEQVNEDMTMLEQLKLDQKTWTATFKQTYDSALDPKKPFRFELKGFGSFGTQQIEQSHTGGETEELATYAKGSTVGFGMLFQARYNGWLGASGVEYLHTKEKVDYGSYQKTIVTINEEMVLDSIFTGQEMIIDSTFFEPTQTWEPDTTFIDIYEYFTELIVDSLSEIVEKERLVKPYNQVISRIDIPFLVGKAFSMGRWELNILAGPSLTFVTRMEGFLIEGEELIVRREHMRSVTLNLHLRGGLAYALNDRWAFEIHTSYRKNLSALVKYGGLEQRYGGLGAGAGVVYRFGGR